tara:strand:- start:39 stop:359 length:321 start_codon:yes stop_codon:yes gene_type:complete
MPELLTHFVDYGIFLAYSVLLWQTLASWRHLKRVTNKRKESILNAILLVMVISILTFVAANAYMLQYRGETLLSIRLFQIFVVANFFVYWLMITLLRREVVDGTTT